MKILQSCSSPSWGGLEMAALRTSIELIERGHDVKILCRKNSRLLKEAGKAGISTVPVYHSKYNFLQSIIDLAAYLLGNKVDVIHSHLSHDLWTISSALRISGKHPKLFLTKHIASGVHKKDLFHKFVYQKVNGIFAISNYIKDNVVDTCPVPAECVYLAIPSLPVDKIKRSNYYSSEIKKKHNIPENKIIAGMAVRFTPGKGLEEFLNSIKILKDKLDAPSAFVIAGEASYKEQEYAKSVFKLCKDLNLEKDVIFTGFVENIYELFSIFDIMVFPSHNESFGVALIEAMAMELPVIASNNAGIPDIVIDGETGILIPPRNSDKLADALLMLLKDETKRKEFGHAGRKRAEQNFNSEKNLKVLESFYNG